MINGTSEGINERASSRTDGQTNASNELVEIFIALISKQTKNIRREKLAGFKWEGWWCGDGHGNCDSNKGLLVV